tara:strand:- start:1302 stop:3143 length:1842 start_codon:yes stop_codon:yes gene_type:complete
MNIQPKASIIIRTLNEAYYLPDLIEGIRSQTFTNWEIIHVDSGSTDDTLNILGPHSAKTITISPQDFTFGYSLNLGCEAATGDYLVIVSAHIRPVNNTWLENLLAPFREDNIGMVYGKQIGDDWTRIGESRDLEKTFGKTSLISIDNPFSHNGNSALPKTLWDTQPFDESLTGLEDLDWSKKIQHRGYRVYYAAHANVYHMHQEPLKKIYKRYLGESIAYSRIFPESIFTKIDLVRGTFTESCRDLLYGINHRKSLKALIGVPFERASHFYGVYQGMNYKNKANRIISTSEEAIYTHSKRISINNTNSHVLENMNLTDPDDNEILIQTGYSRLQSNDLAMLLEECPITDKLRYPITPGFQFSGIVMKKGKSVNKIKVGDKIISVSKNYNGALYDEKGLNILMPKESHANFVYSNITGVHKIPIQMPLLHGIFVEPLAIGLNLLRRIETRTDSTACVIGAGYMGNILTQLMLIEGIHVTCVDANEDKLSLVSKYGADTLIKCVDYSKFDYIVNTSCNDDHFNNEHISNGIILCENNCKTISQLSNQNPTPLLITSYEDEDLTRAIDVILARQINLIDHGLPRYGLDNYAEACAEYKKSIHLNIIIEPNKQLAAL